MLLAPEVRVTAPATPLVRLPSPASEPIASLKPLRSKVAPPATVSGAAGTDRVGDAELEGAGVDGRRPGVRVDGREGEGAAAFLGEAPGSADHGVHGERGTGIGDGDAVGGGEGHRDADGVRRGHTALDQVPGAQRDGIAGQGVPAARDRDAVEAGGRGEVVGVAQARRAAREHQVVARDRCRAAPVPGRAPIAVSATTGPCSRCGSDVRADERAPLGATGDTGGGDAVGARIGGGAGQVQAAVAGLVLRAGRRRGAGQAADDDGVRGAGVQCTQDGGCAGDFCGRGGGPADEDGLVIGLGIAVNAHGSCQDVDARRGEEGLGAVVAAQGELVGLVGRGDAHHAAVAGRVDPGGRAVVAVGRDDDHVVGPGVVDGQLEGRRVAGVAEGHQDHVRAAVDGGDDAGNDGAVLARAVGAENRDGQHAHTRAADPRDTRAVVRGRGDDARHPGAVAVRIGVHRRAVDERLAGQQPALEVGLLDVRAGVEDGHGHAARGQAIRIEGVPADPREGPLDRVAGIAWRRFDIAALVQLDGHDHRTRDEHGSVAGGGRGVELDDRHQQLGNRGHLDRTDRTERRGLLGRARGAAERDDVADGLESARRRGRRGGGRAGAGAGFRGGGCIGSRAWLRGGGCIGSGAGFRRPVARGGRRVDPRGDRRGLNGRSRRRVRFDECPGGDGRLRLRRVGRRPGSGHHQGEDVERGEQGGSDPGHSPRSRPDHGTASPQGMISGVVSAASRNITG